MFTQVLKQLRKEARLTQERISETLQVPMRTYGSWERGERQPDLDIIIRIADYFNVTTDCLLGRTPMDTSAKPETPPPPFDEDKRRLQSTLDEAPQDENNLERLIRNLIRQEVQQELEKRGL